MTEKYYPININITEKKCVVVGCGSTGERKIISLLECGARVLAVSRKFTPAVEKLIFDNKIEGHQREFRPEDLDGAFLVYCATDDRELNELVYKIAEDNGSLVNIVDAPEICNFIVPAVIRRGPLCVAISTSGAAPSLAKKIKKDIEKMIPKNYEGYIDFLAEKRLEIKGTVGEIEVRKAIFEEMVGSAILEHMLAGEREKAETAYREILKKFFA
ncbi:MAG TPA: bifunctional precorrin-2 dehydrogenase/sirohydrochlorin ferrochelatase [Candidatus Wallbacteria bacterium]|nr:bifunctional precorrin-2 dehydrogenase/sirohydrochlorin ferrochelatase [Candidatus Wallbacteria bacterium]